GERAYVVLSSAEGMAEHPMLPDVSVSARGTSRKRRPRTAGAAVAERPKALPMPITMRALVETEFRETFVEIRELNPQHTLITCIEILSLSNKRVDSPGGVQYLRKRQALLSGQSNLIELDLLRGGQ